MVVLKKKSHLELVLDDGQFLLVFRAELPAHGRVADGDDNAFDEVGGADAHNGHASHGQRAQGHAKPLLGVLQGAPESASELS